MDELIWGAIWIYKATNDYYYLEQAEILFEEANFYSPKVFSWDDKRAGILVCFF
jgi:lantibiotic modifying enzyme